MILRYSIHEKMRNWIFSYVIKFFVREKEFLKKVTDWEKKRIIEIEKFLKCVNIWNVKILR
jgi:hypothetical protein